MNDDTQRSGAPGQLEDVRTLLNSWSLSNTTRQEVDDLWAWMSRPELWHEKFRFVPAPRSAEFPQLRALRQAMRAFITGQPESLNVAIASGGRFALQTRLERVEFIGDGTTRGELEATLLNAVTSNQAVRLRACDDCGWVFFDGSRNNRRRWCAMEPSAGVRGCGAAAKAKRYRRKQAHDQPPPPST